METRKEKLEILKGLFHLYAEQCSISAGYRTILWDMAWQFMEKHNLGNGWRDLKEYSKQFLSDWDEIDEYDVIAMEKREYAQVLQQMIEEGVFSANAGLLELAKKWRWKFQEN